MDPVSEVVADLWSNIYAVARPTSNRHHLRPRGRGRLAREAIQQVFVAAKVRYYGRDLLGHGQYPRAALRQALERQTKTPAYRHDAEGLEKLPASTNGRGQSIVPPAPGCSAGLGSTA